MIERWRDIEDFEGLYQVSDLGRVRSVRRTVPRERYGIWRWEGRLMRQRTGDESGHLAVCLWKGGVKQSLLVNQIVLTTFVCPRPEGSVCLHGLKGISDNSVENLRWSKTNEK